MDLDDWKPYTPQQVHELLEGTGLPYWIAGGYALELWLGQAYRDHADLDLAIPRSAQPLLRSALPNYCFYAADPPGQLRIWPKAEWLARPIDDVWVKERAEGPFVFQIMFVETSEDRWVFKRNPLITGLISEFGLDSLAGYRIISPHIQLLYKAKAVREKDELDFKHCLPQLNAPQRRWLKGSLERTYPGHRWISELANAAA